jgi:hypothetical protein
MFGDLVQAGIGLVVLIIVVFYVVLPNVNVALYGAAATQTNLSGAALTMAQQTPLFTVLALVFVPLAVLAISAFRSS